MSRWQASRATSGGISSSEQNASGARDSEAAQACRAGRDRDGDGEVEREEEFAAFGLATDDSNRLLGRE